MKTYTITKKDLNDKNEYIGKEDLTDFNGNIETDENLGRVLFYILCVKGRILFKAGCGIEAGWGIKAGCGIEVGWGIEAGCGIEAGDGIKAGWGIEAGDGIKAGCGIEAGDGIKAGCGIEVGWGIKAGCGIEAGDGIKAGWGITCTTLFSKLRIFAGLCIWRNPTKGERSIKCDELVGGEICYGNLIINEKKSDFEVWWNNEGSGMQPIDGHDHEEHAKRIAEIAWNNGAFKRSES